MVTALGVKRAVATLSIEFKNANTEYGKGDSFTLNLATHQLV